MIEERCEQVPARDVKVGHLLDLYGDPYADPKRDPGQGLEFELALVGGNKFEAGKRGSVDCVTIYSDAVNFTCPPDHLLKVRGFDPDCEEF